MTRLRDLLGRRREERGDMGLIELIVAGVVMLVVTGAALSAFEVYDRVDRDTVKRMEAQDIARTSLDRLARQLRNLASPTPEQPQAIDKATGYDVVFQTVDPIGPNAGTNSANVQRVRWCLDGATPARLWMQTQSWTSTNAPAVPSTTVCPASGWDTRQAVAGDVVSRRGGQNRPVFSFDSTSLVDISSVHAALVVDRDVGRGAEETTLSTGVFLRNQNRRPTAAFTATSSAQGLVLNGSLSQDPEGQELGFAWYDGTQLVGTGVVFTYQVPAGSEHAISLRVTDPADLEGTSAVQQVTA